MKRSVINANIEWAMDLCKRMNFQIHRYERWTDPSTSLPL